MLFCEFGFDYKAIGLQGVFFNYDVKVPGIKITQLQNFNQNISAGKMCCSEEQIFHKDGKYID